MDNLIPQPQPIAGFDSDTLAKLTTALAGDIDLYNQLVNTVQEKESEIGKYKSEAEEAKAKLAESEARNQQYLQQISNLLARIPVAPSQQPKTLKDKVEEIKSRSWATG